MANQMDDPRLVTVTGLIACTAVAVPVMALCHMLDQATSVTGSLVAGAIMVTVVVHLYYRQHRIPRIRHIRSGRGLSAIRLVKRAKDSIFVTHFTGETPDLDYVAEMKSRLGAGTTITRILPSGIDRSAPEHQWLQDFQVGAGLYREVKVPWRLPLDVMVVDGRWIQLLFPTDRSTPLYRQGAIIQDHRLANLFKTALERTDTLDP